jgi:hypothetical protein
LPAIACARAQRRTWIFLSAFNLRFTELPDGGKASVEMWPFGTEPPHRPRVSAVIHHQRNEHWNTMEQRNNLPGIGSLCAALMMLVSIGLRAAGPPASPLDEAVVITGWLQTQDLTMVGAVVSIEVNGEYHTTTVPESGRFDVSLPADVEAVLRFEKPGHLPKEVVVDTHHVNDGDFDGRTRHVKFAVVLELERRMGGLTYPGPVGSLGFDKDGGCLAVAHDRTLVPASRDRIMVF